MALLAHRTAPVRVPAHRVAVRAAPASRRRVCAPRALGLLPDGPLFSPAEVERATYAVLAGTGVLFLGTFLVIPRFKDQFKEEVDWRTIYADLVASGGVKEVTAEEAYKKRSLLLDVRVASKYAAGHPAGAISAPLYMPISKWDVPSILRRAAFAFFGIAGTELNSQFPQDVQALVPKGKDIVLVCETGGSLQNKPGTQFGFQSRALKAAYFLKKAGYTKVSYMKGGVALWSSAGLPLEAGDGAEQEFAARSGRGGTQQQRAGTTTSNRNGSGSESAAKKLLGVFGRKE